MHGEAKEWLDAFFFDRYLYVNNSAATSFAHAPYMQHAVNSNACEVYTKINIPKRDGHTYIPMQNEMRSRISCLALKRSAVM